MTKAQLKEYLDRHGFNPQTYSLEPGVHADQYVLEENYGKWPVYYSERGIRTGEKVFNNEEEACAYLLEILSKDPTTH
jgi:hypothetical protein